MSVLGLAELVSKAVLLADPPCERGEHAWEMIGGRQCPYGGDDSQPIFRCRRCDSWDYGDPGGPGWRACEEGECGCSHSGRWRDYA